MSRPASSVFVLVLSMLAALAGAGSGGAATLCVGAKAQCFPSLQAAVDAAQDGDVIHVGPGTFAGGVVISKSVDVIGSGASATAISGGGPVLTIGAPGAHPSVRLVGITVTGGLNTSSPSAFGGGIVVLADASLRLVDSVVAGNHAAPASTIPSRNPCGIACPFAQASGGGIDNFGTMMLVDVRVTNNAADGPVTSDADGGGIMNERGAVLVVRDSVVSGNAARATLPFGRFAEAGGIFSRRGSTLTVVGSVVGENVAELATAFSADIAAAQTGGIKLAGDESTTGTIVDSRIDRNRVIATSTGGDLVAFSGGIDNDGSLVLRDSTVDGNRVDAWGNANVSVDGGGLELEGSTAAIADAHISGNGVAAHATGGDALAQAGGVLIAGEDEPASVTITNTIVGDNTADGTSIDGSALAQGGGILNGARLDLRDSVVSGNAASANAANAAAEGGGIWNGDLGFGTPALSLRSVLLTGNTPDDCFGC
jgi:hypothetical protein